MNPAQIYLLRHGETEWNAASRFQGRLDSPLTPNGIAQARAIGHRLAPLAGTIDMLVSSPLGRAKQTANILGAQGPYPAIRWDERLQEVSIGAWDGLTHIDIDAGWPGRLDGASPFDWFFRSPDGETYAAVVARVQSWLASIEGTIIAASHGLVGRIIRGAYLGLPKEQALQLPVPQGVVWHLHAGTINEFR